MGQAGHCGWGFMGAANLTQAASSGHKEPAGCWLAAPRNAVPPRSPQARAETSGWGQTNPGPGLVGAERVLSGTWRRGRSSRPPPPHRAQPAPRPLTVGAKLPGLSICLVVVYGSPRARLAASGEGVAGVGGGAARISFQGGREGHSQRKTRPREQ